MSERDSMPYDIVIVGGGPAGLTAAIRLKQLADAAGICGGGPGQFGLERGIIRMLGLQPS